MGSVASYGSTSDPLSTPALGGPSGWAAAVSAALNGSDTTVDARLLAGGVKFGYRITRPSTDDRLVEQWNGSAWSVVGYDSGWRLVTSGLVNGWSASGVRLRRVNATVFIQCEALSSGSSPASGVPYVLPVGFRNASGGFTRGLLHKTDASLRRYTIASDGSITIASYAAYDTLYGEIVTSTTNTPPTSLPGTLVTAAPA